MDILRSRYSPKMRFYTDAGLIDVVWCKAAKGAKAFPGIHCFASQDYDEEQDDLALGESRPPRGAWANGIRPALLRGNGFLRGSPSAFLNGQETIDLVPVGVTCANEPLDLAVYPLALPTEDDQESAEGAFSFGTGGVRWAENLCFAANSLRNHLLPACLNVPELFNVWQDDDPILPNPVGTAIVTWNQKSLSWKGIQGYGSFPCVPGVDMTCEVKPLTSKLAEIIWTLPPNPCGSGGTIRSYCPLDSPGFGLPGTVAPIMGSFPEVNSPPVISCFVQFP